MRHLLLILSLLTCSVIAHSQSMLGKGLDDILSKYQTNKNFRLSVLRTPKGTVIPKMRITSTVQMRDTGDSENSLITYKELKTAELYTFYLINDRCITFEHSYPISKLNKVKTDLNKLYKKTDPEGIASDRWMNSDGSIMISVIPYESLKRFDVQYSIQ